MFFSHSLQISNFPLFSLFQFISPYFGKFFFPPNFANFPSDFEQFTSLFTYFPCISSPPTLTMMHICIRQCTYWTPLLSTSWLNAQTMLSLVLSSETVAFSFVTYVKNTQRSDTNCVLALTYLLRRSRTTKISSID